MNPSTDTAPGSHLATDLYVKGKNGLKLRDERVRRLVRRMQVALPHLTDSDLPACRSWAEFEVLCTRIYAELRDKGFLNAEGEGRRLLDDYRKLRATQLAFSRELGLTPASRTAIRADEPVDLVA